MGLFGKRCLRCNRERTRKSFEGLPTCDECELEIHASREVKRACPIDATPMNKEVLCNVILDRCPSCQGVWLDGGELELLQQSVEVASGDFATGLVMGMVTE